MNKPSSEVDNILTSSNNSSPHKSDQCLRNTSLPSSSCPPSSPSLPFYLLSISVLLFILFQIRSPTWVFMHQWEKIVTKSGLSTSLHNTGDETRATTTNSKLREAVTFLPLKDLRYAGGAMKGHTWFMNSMYDTHEEGEVQYQQFPSKASRDRLLCLKGHDTHDGSWNLYALAWRETLPPNATLMNSITFVSYNHYDYHNIWHGLSAIMPFVAWHIKSQCAAPRRWILYHWGELRTTMAPWVRTLLKATFGGGPVHVESFDGDVYRHDDVPACFEETVVMRHNEGGMSREKRMETYDLMRCKSRMYCKVESSRDKGPHIGMTMLMRDGARSFRNASAVVGIFEKECRKVEGCQLMVAYPHNLTFCQQVKLMSWMDIVVSVLGAQLSNMIMMDRNNSVMEMFPKGWLELAGVGQYVHHWLASWSGMRHEGAWRDPIGNPCPYPENDRHRCMSFFKDGKIGHNETYFSEWAGKVLAEVKLRKAQKVSMGPVSVLCGCNWL